MKIEDAYRKLPEYVDGGLSAGERAQIEELLLESPELESALALSKSLEQSLRIQPWLEPSRDFTRNVLQRLRITPVRQAAGGVVVWDRIKAILSAAALLVMLAFYGKTMFVWSGELLTQAGGWLGTVTGYTLFAVHPAMLLGLLAPLMAGGYATCVLTGHCRLNT